MSALHIIVDHVPASGHSAAYFALAGALGGAVVVGVLGLLGQHFHSSSENKRLEQQLEHDRDQRDLEVLRLLLGEAAEALGGVRKAYIRLLRFWVPQTQVANLRREAAEAEQREASGAARSVLDRLRIQLEPDNPIMAAYESAMTTLDAIAELYLDVDRGQSEANRSRLKELGDKLGSQMDDFARLSRSRVGPRVLVTTREDSMVG